MMVGESLNTVDYCLSLRAPCTSGNEAFSHLRD